MHDVLTDLVCEHAQLETETHGTGHAHAGMLKAAGRLRASLDDLLKRALAEHLRVRSIIFTGHSLGAGVASLLALMMGPTVHLGARQVRVHAFAYAVPALVSLPLAQSASEIITSVIETVDMVPRFSLATTVELRETLGHLHHEDRLLERISRHRQAFPSDGPTQPAEGSIDAEDAAWATSVLRWLRAEHSDAPAARQKLYPPGRILWHPARPQGPAPWVLADAADFDNLLLCGSQMVTAHVPSAYARALLGNELPLAALRPIPTIRESGAD
jgi:pimeloyl-ACP methyl ester carboxylesterase